MKFPLNSPLYTTFLLLSPLSAIIFPPPPLSRRAEKGRKKAPTVGPGQVRYGAYLEISLFPTLIKTLGEGFTRGFSTWGALCHSAKGANQGKDSGEGDQKAHYSHWGGL